MRGFRPGDANFVRPIDKPVYAIACSRFCHSLPSLVQTKLCSACLPPLFHLGIAIARAMRFVSALNSLYCGRKRESRKKREKYAKKVSRISDQLIQNDCNFRVSIVNGNGTHPDFITKRFIK